MAGASLVFVAPAEADLPIRTYRGQGKTYDVPGFITPCQRRDRGAGVGAPAGVLLVAPEHRLGRIGKLGI